MPFTSKEEIQLNAVELANKVAPTVPPDVGFLVCFWPKLSPRHAAMSGTPANVEDARRIIRALLDSMSEVVIK